ncbi:hypothetical protein PISMIDRAFT_25291 [Pisolithus microcarpus 441]|uniref:Uncharacterized protein n=1 Tax=Pisolithus microcarpus 441 TaxID=765257 RepID=A0A0C9XSE6_9AGAM|nr:hypothetical protein BKA83DRAFT_25291 [Pisolithus microcarpus]KIK15250.1 hypothetical protein PISMIDRAFT_25291 [Pisolithus microcarpus 441]
MSPFRPTTRSMSRKGMRHYSPYNLRSRGSHQTFECLPTPSGSPTRPRSSSTDGDAGGLWTPAGEFTYDTLAIVQKRLKLCLVNSGAPYWPSTLDSPFLTMNWILLQKLCHPIQVGHVETLVRIANTIIDDLEYNILGYGHTS